MVRRLDEGLRALGRDSSVVSWAPVPRAEPGPSGWWAWTSAKITAAWARDRAARAAAATLRTALEADQYLVAVLDTGSFAVAHHLAGVPRWGLHVHWTPDLVLQPWRHLAGEGVPRILTVLVSLRMRVAGRSNRRLLRSAPFVVSLTSSHTRVLRDVGARVHEVGNPMDSSEIATRSRPEPGDPVTVGYLGRLSYEKGPDVLLDALRLVRDPERLIRTLVAGAGPLEPALRRQVADEHVPGVEFLGWVDDPRALLARIDVLVLPSRAEAVPLVLAEALAAGCVVVAAAAGGGVRDVLLDGQLGTIVAREDPAALAHAIEQAVVSVRAGSLPDRTGVADLLERHSPSHVLGAWVSLLDGQVGGAPPPAG